MKKLMLLGTYLLMFLGLNSVCSALTVTIKTGDISGLVADAFIEVNIKVLEGSTTISDSGYIELQSNTSRTVELSEGQTIRIFSRRANPSIPDISTTYNEKHNTIDNPIHGATYKINFPSGATEVSVSQ